MTPPDHLLGYHPDCGHELAAGLAVEFVVDDEGGITSACDTGVAVVETGIDDADRLTCADADCEYATPAVRRELRRETLRHCGVVSPEDPRRGETDSERTAAANEGSQTDHED